MPELLFENFYSIEEIEENFKDVDLFSGLMDGLQEALAYKKRKTVAGTIARKQSLPAVNIWK